jgi:hypothetical protein
MIRLCQRTTTRPNVTPRIARSRRAQRDRRRRDRAILQLWRDGWTAKKIAARLDITPAIVGNVVHERGATRNTRTSPSNGCVAAPDKAREDAYRPYFWRVMDGVFRQVDEGGGTCPSFITIPEPADDYQREHITQTIEWWARQAFNLPTIEIRTDQGQRVH